MTKRITACAFGLALLLSLGVGVASSEEMPQGVRRYYLGLIFRGPAWTPEDTPERQALQEAHMANIRRLAKNGDLVLAGPCLDDGDLRGIFVYEAPSLKAAQALVASDPAVKAGRLRVELHPWWGPVELKDLYAASSE